MARMQYDVDASLVTGSLVIDFLRITMEGTFMSLAKTQRKMVTGKIRLHAQEGKTITRRENRCR